MKKSTKFLIGGIFCIAVVFAAGMLFDYLGLDFGLTQMTGSVFAGMLGASRLISG